MADTDWMQRSIYNSRCSLPGRAGFVCPRTLADFSSTSNGTALEGAEGRLDPDPDIAGFGIFLAFILAFVFSTVLAFLIHMAERSEILTVHDPNRGSIRARHPKVKRTHHVMDKLLVAWSDQQLILGLATAGAALHMWCSLSTYHMNLVKQWLVFCSVTHINALLVHCDYFNKDHMWANMMRVALIVVHAILSGVILMAPSRDAHQWSPGVGDQTPLQALPAPCFFQNAAVSTTLQKVPGWGATGFDSKYLFIFSLIMIGLALASLLADYWWRHARKIHPGLSHHLWWARLGFLVGNLVIGILVFYHTYSLRVYMNNYKWLSDDSENKMSYGQFVPILLAIFVVFSALQSVADEIPNREHPAPAGTAAAPAPAVHPDNDQIPMIQQPQRLQLNGYGPYGNHNHLYQANP